MNERIRISPIRVVNADGEMLGEMETEEALKLAIEQGLDLVEVSPDARPPVCRIMNYGKVIYERQKKTSGSKQHKTQLKQLRLRAKTGDSTTLMLKSIKRGSFSDDVTKLKSMSCSVAAKTLITIEVVKCLKRS